MHGRAWCEHAPSRDRGTRLFGSQAGHPASRSGGDTDRAPDRDGRTHAGPRANPNRVARAGGKVTADIALQPHEVIDTVFDRLASDDAPSGVAIDFAIA
jgi:hypothetical protein